MNFVKSSQQTVKAFSVKQLALISSAAMSLCSSGFAGALFAKHAKKQLEGMIG